MIYTCIYRTTSSFITLKRLFQYFLLWIHSWNLVSTMSLITVPWQLFIWISGITNANKFHFFPVFKLRTIHIPLLLIISCKIYLMLDKRHVQFYKQNSSTVVDFKMEYQSFPAPSILTLTCNKIPFKIHIVVICQYITVIITPSHYLNIAPSFTHAWTYCSPTYLFSIKTLDVANAFKRYIILVFCFL